MGPVGASDRSFARGGPRRWADSPPAAIDGDAIANRHDLRRQWRQLDSRNQRQPRLLADAVGHGPRMRSYLLIGLIFLLVIWDIAQNRGQSVRMVGAWVAGFLRAIGIL
jgi:hypothetical protein